MASERGIERRSRLASGPAIVVGIAAAVLVLHLVTASRYGYFGDELYFLACGRHLAWGYVDQPPLIALLAWLTSHTLGTSLLAIRLLPALTGFALVWLTGLIARELGGGRFAQALAALCTAGAGVYLVLGHLFTMNAFEPLLWMGCAWVVIRIVRTGDQKLWLWFGLLMGIGLENKYSIAFFGLAVVVGLLLTKERKAFASRWIWLAGLLCFAIFLPNLVWNVQNHFPFLELIHNIRASGRDLLFTPLAYLRAQIVLIGPFAFPVWLAGTLYFLFDHEGRTYRVLGWTFLTLLTLLILLHGKDYYAAPVFPMVLAGGAVAVERLSSRRRMGWLRPAAIVLVLASSLAFLPMVVPVLAPEALVRYEAKLPFEIQPDEKSMLAERIPHYYAFSFGWDETVEKVAEVWHALPQDERADTAIFANDFASAGAIDLLGEKYGLPKAISGHQSYWSWGPRGYSGRTMILVATPLAAARRWFDRVTVAAELHDPYASPWEQRPILLCRGPKRYVSLAEAWPHLKHWS